MDLPYLRVLNCDITMTVFEVNVPVLAKCVENWQGNILYCTGGAALTLCVDLRHCCGKCFASHLRIRFGFLA